jgi:hypothetical protein
MMTNQTELATQIHAIPDIFKLMTFDAEDAFNRNETFMNQESEDGKLQPQPL